MEKQIIKELLQTNSDKEKEEYIRDLGNSVSLYVKTGDRTELLDNFLQYAIEVKCEIEKTYNEKVQTKNKMEECMKKIMYLSHLNMLYEMCMQEMRVREEQENFVKATKKFPKLFDIVTEINKNRRLNSVELKKICFLSDREYGFVIMKYREYFNLHKGPNKEISQISLSPTGKKYLAYMRDKGADGSSSQIDKVVVRNCEAIMKAIPASLVMGMPKRVDFYKLNTESERSLQFMYDQMIFDVGRKSRSSYYIKINEPWRRECYDGVKEEFRFTNWSVK